MPPGPNSKWPRGLGAMLRAVATVSSPTRGPRDDREVGLSQQGTVHNKHLNVAKQEGTQGARSRDAQ